MNIRRVCNAINTYVGTFLHSNAIIKNMLISYSCLKNVEIERKQCMYVAKGKLLSRSL